MGPVAVKYPSGKRFTLLLPEEIHWLLINLSSYALFNPSDHASSDIPFHRSISASLLSNDLTVIKQLGKGNVVLLNQSKTKQAVISRKHNQNFPPVLMNGDELDTSSSFTQLGLSLSSNLTWKAHIHSLAKHASQKLGFLARARGFLSSSHLLTIYKSQIRPPNLSNLFPIVV